MQDNQLQVILKEQNVAKENASALLESFGAPFAEAGEILADYQSIKVNDIADLSTMKVARDKRLALKKVRTTVENKRKELKEDIVKQGRAIDSVARFVKEVISPAEEYLQLQEDFTKIQAEKVAAERLQKRTEQVAEYSEPSLYNLADMNDELYSELLASLKQKAADEAAAAKKAEADRLAAEEAERKRQAEIEAENVKLRKQAEEQEAKLAKEREASEKAAAIEKAKADKILEEERQKREALEAADRKRRDEELAAVRAEQEKAAAEEAAQRQAMVAPDKVKLERFVEALKVIRDEKIPAVQSKKAQDVTSYIDDELSGIISTVTAKIKAL